jgi:DHA1 family multidrug resistance protein-like MFS transporter
MGFLQSGPAAGSITGPLIGGALVQLWGIHWTFYLSAAAQIVATILVLMLVREPAPPRKGMRLELVSGLLAAWRFPALRKILGLTMLVQLGTTLIEPLITLYVGEFPGVTAVPFLAGLLFSLLGVASVICSPWWGRRGERRGYGPVVLWGLAGAGVGNALQLVVGSLWSFGAIRLLTGAAYAGANTGLGTLAATAVPDEFRGRAYGLLTASQQFGNLIGPLAGGIWAGFYGIHSAFGLSSLVFVAALGLAALWTRRRVAWADVSIR